MRRRAIRQGVYEIAKPVFDILRCDAQDIKNLLLDIPLVDPDTPTTDLITVAHKIVVLTLNLPRIRV